MKVDMESVEVTGKSLEDAKREAAQRLGCAPEDIEATVLEESKGLFGKVSVRISARRMEAPSEPAAAKPPAKRGRAPKEPAETVAPVATEETPAPAVPKARRTARKPTEDTGPAAAAAPTAERQAKPEHVATDEDAGKIVDIVTQILKLGDLNAGAKCTGMSGKYVNIELDGKDVAYLVGKRGEVLNAFQYLINVIAAQQFPFDVRVTLEGDNYRRRREQALQKLSVQIAEQVRERGEEAVLDALPAFERRVVHKSLQEYAGVTTYSEGEEPNRRVVIAPAE